MVTAADRFIASRASGTPHITMGPGSDTTSGVAPPPYARPAIVAARAARSRSAGPATITRFAREDQASSTADRFGLLVAITLHRSGTVRLPAWLLATKK